jgi:hypothetical protein
MPLLADDPFTGDASHNHASHGGHPDLLCEKLAKANIIALRGWPVFKSWALFGRFY